MERLGALATPSVTMRERSFRRLGDDALLLFDMRALSQNKGQGAWVGLILPHGATFGTCGEA